MGNLRIVSFLGSFQRLLSLFLVGVGLIVAIAGCSATAANKDTVELTLVSFAVTRAAYEQIIPKFAAKWEQEHGQRVSVARSYGASGSQTRAVLDGLEADVVALALALDTKKIEAAGLIEPGWEQEAPNDSIVHQSVATLVTRAGNPKGIIGWRDLANPNVQVITANPKTSGGARWNFLGIWGSVTATGGTDNAALDYATRVFKNAPVLPRDSREATDAFFNQGQGDVLINYENEVILAKLNGKDLPYVVPDVNVSIDSPIALVDAYVDKHGTRNVAEAFVQFLFTPEAQREFAKVGFRSIDPAIAKEFANQYPQVNTLFTVQDIGGWNTAQAKFFSDGAIFDQIQAAINS
jgi:sulfate transport system substrate-binding protein